MDEWQAPQGRVAGGFRDGGGLGGGLALPLGDARVIAWDSNSSEHILVSDGVLNAVMQVVPIAVPRGPNPSILAAGTRDGVRLIDLRDGSTIRTIKGEPPGFLAFSDDVRRLAIVSAHGPWTITTIDTTTGVPVAPTVTVPWPAGIAIDGTGTRLAVGSTTGGDARLIDVATGATIGEPLSGQQLTVALSGDGSLMAAASLDGRVRVVETAGGAPIVPDVTVPTAKPVGVAFSPNNDALLVAGSDGKVAVIDLVGRRKIGRPLEVGGWLGFFSPDATLVAVNHREDNEVSVLDVASGRLLQTLRPAQPWPNPALLTGPINPAFSPDGSEIAIGSAAGGGRPAAIEVFSVADGRSLRRLEVPDVPSVGIPLAWSPDGSTLAAGLSERLLLLDALTGRKLDELPLPGMLLPYFALYDEQGRLLVSGDPQPGITFVFSAPGTLMRKLDGGGTWGPNGTIALSHQGEVRLIDSTSVIQPLPSTGRASRNQGRSSAGMAVASCST